MRWQAGHRGSQRMVIPNYQRGNCLLVKMYPTQQALSVTKSHSTPSTPVTPSTPHITEPPQIRSRPRRTTLLRRAPDRLCLRRRALAARTTRRTPLPQASPHGLGLQHRAAHHVALAPVVQAPLPDLERRSGAATGHRRCHGVDGDQKRTANGFIAKEMF